MLHCQYHRAGVARWSGRLWCSAERDTMASQQAGATPIAVEEWLNSRPSWLRAAALALIQSRRMPSDSELDELASHCLAEATNRLREPAPSLEAGMIAGTPGAAGLRVDRVFDINGVNALGSRANLQLTEADLAIVYGPNGSGKSGYARLMKHLCGARIAGTIHDDVFRPDRTEASATVELRALSGGDPAAEVTVHHWTARQGPLSALKSVPVFDSATAVEFGESPSAATHTPRSMRFVSSLIRISDQVAENLRQRAKLLVSQMPALPADLAGTPTEDALKQLLQPATSQATIAAACHFTAEERAEQVDLAAALAQPNPTVAHAKILSDLSRLEKVKSWGTRLEAALSADIVAKIVAARVDSATKREAATAHAGAFFRGLPLSGVAEDAWRQLWEAAAAYSNTRAYPGHTHPNTAEGSRCVLCQQLLDAEARSRLQGFGDFVQSRLESTAAMAEKQYAELLAALPNSPDPETWASILQEVQLDLQTGESLRRAIEAQLAALKIAVDRTQVPAADWRVWHLALQARTSTLVAQRDALAALIDEEGRAAKNARLVALKGKEWLANHESLIAVEVARLRQCAEIEGALRLASTNALTTKNNEIGRLELARGFCHRFNDEMRRLGGHRLPVIMSHRSQGKGTVAFCVELRDPQRRIHNKDVLSEGEQRVVALAAFLADATGTDRSLPIIFDDPISSLDQRFEESVADRLVELAQSRQVLVFTHRLSLMVLLQNSAKKGAELDGMKARVRVLSIARYGAETGIPSLIDVFSMRPKEGFARVIQDAHEAKKRDNALREAVLKSACSNFRILVERSVEHHLCSGVVMRFRREVQTMNKLTRLTAIRPEDCSLIDRMMTKYSAYEHSQSIETPTWLPEPEELIEDTETMMEWIKRFDKHAEDVVARKAAR